MILHDASSLRFKHRSGSWRLNIEQLICVEDNFWWDKLYCKYLSLIWIVPVYANLSTFNVLFSSSTLW